MAVGLEGVVRFKVDWIKMDYWLPVGGVWERDEARMSLRFLAKASRRRVRSSS